MQLGTLGAEAAFADARTYAQRQGRRPADPSGLRPGGDGNVVLAANAGKVVNADWLGIYGNCVIIDHGMGVFVLYGHLYRSTREGR
ncbi:MAG: M23 family metallopeptidase [Vicinamibacterales bacterium]